MGRAQGTARQGDTHKPTDENAEPAPRADAAPPIALAPTPAASVPLAPAEVRAIFVGLMLAAFLSALNQTIIATALPTIGRHFHDFENLSWVVTAYLLTSTAVSPLFGKLSDIHGRRAIMLAGIGLFIAGSAVCAAAPNMTTLILGRGLQGLGGGGIFPLAQAIIADMITPRERGRYQAYMSIVWVTSGVGGPVLGGVLAEYLHWSLIFWLNVPLGLAAAQLTHTRLKRLPRHDRKHKLDLVGAFLMMAAAIPLLLALGWGGTRFPWTSPTIIALIAGSLALSLAFAWHIVRAPEPFLPLSVLANPVMRMGTAASSFAMAVSIALTIFVPLYYEVVHKLSASEAGLALIPLALTTPGSILSGRALIRGRQYKWVPMVGLACGIVALGVLCIWPAPPLWAVILVLCVVGTSTGTVYPVCTVSIQNAVPHAQVGIAMGAMNFFRALACALLVAVVGAIVFAGFGATPNRATGTQTIAAAATATGFDMAGVFRWVYAVSAAMLLASFIALWLMEERPLRGPTAPAPVA
jgi:EmrB/QacA subfamily drug resistance transporter